MASARNCLRCAILTWGLPQRRRGEGTPWHSWRPVITKQLRPRTACAVPLLPQRSPQAATWARAWCVHAPWAPFVSITSTLTPLKPRPACPANQASQQMALGPQAPSNAALSCLATALLLCKPTGRVPQACRCCPAAALAACRLHRYVRWGSTLMVATVWGALGARSQPGQGQKQWRNVVSSILLFV